MFEYEIIRLIIFDYLLTIYKFDYLDLTFIIHLLSIINHIILILISIKYNSSIDYQ